MVSLSIIVGGSKCEDYNHNATETLVDREE